MNTYQDQLKDPRWIELRERIIEKARRICSICNSVDNTLQVHHLVYHDGLMAWEYEENELLCICDNCHEDYHKAVKWRQKQISEIHPGALLPGLKHDPYKMADTIAELSGRLAELSWITIRGIPL